VTYIFVAGKELTVLTEAKAGDRCPFINVEIIEFDPAQVIKRPITVQFFGSQEHRARAEFQELQISSVLVIGDVYWVAFWQTLCEALRQGSDSAKLVLESPTHVVGRVESGRRAILTTSVGRLVISEDRFGGWNLIGAPADINQFQEINSSYSDGLRILGDYCPEKWKLIMNVMGRQGCGPFEAMVSLENLGVPVYDPTTQRLVRIPYFDFGNNTADEE